MGQMGAAWTDRSHLNTMNPAAPAFLSRTTFSSGLEVRSERIMEGDSTTRGELGGLTQVAFALKRAGGKTAFTFGVQPRSQAGYNVSQVLENSVTDQYQIRYFGSGGLSEAYAGLARRWEGKTWRTFTDSRRRRISDSVRIITQAGPPVGGRFEQSFWWPEPVADRRHCQPHLYRHPGADRRSPQKRWLHLRRGARAAHLSAV